MLLRFQAGSSSLYIAPVYLQEEPEATQINHNRAFCTLYSALEKKEPKEVAVKKVITTRIKDKITSPTLRRKTV
jgi:hypothetical protein